MNKETECGGGLGIRVLKSYLLWKRSERYFRGRCEGTIWDGTGNQNVNIVKEASNF